MQLHIKAATKRDQPLRVEEARAIRFQMERTPDSPVSRLTRTGRLLLLVHLLLAIGGSALYIVDFLPKFPAGRYPVLMFVIPVGLASAFLFFIIAWILERLGVRIYRGSGNEK